MNRKKLYDLVEPPTTKGQEHDPYDIFLLCVILVSIIPLAFKRNTTLLTTIDIFCTIVFIIDYILRWATADYRSKRTGLPAFLSYPFTPMAIIDLISILPGLTNINKGFRLLKFFRLIRTFRVFRVFKVARYSKNVAIVLRVFQKQKDSLLIVCGLAVGYILISGLIMFNIEPATFPTFFDAIYWATVSLTTVGYGDIYAVSVAGRFITMISSMFGIAIVALPAGIITAGYMEEIRQEKEEEKEVEQKKE